MILKGERSVVPGGLRVTLIMRYSEGGLFCLDESTVWLEGRGEGGEVEGGGREGGKENRGGEGRKRRREGEGEGGMEEGKRRRKGGGGKEG